ncbi:MAG TPA: fluoride efflux transporter CrcB [Allosphingosinicella sp.]|jgi:CrcB protein
MPHLLLVMLGGAIGAALRYLVGLAALRGVGPDYPWGTLIVNLSGGFLMGLLAGILARGGNVEGLRAFAGVGILGGFTTFSAFSLETANMIERGQLLGAAGYSLASLFGAVAMLFLGLFAMRAAA